MSRIVQRLLKVSSTAMEHAEMILWNMCCLIKERVAPWRKMQ